MTLITEQQRELIDTLWNVNYIRKLADGINVLELIDTLWNVNSKVFDEQVGQNIRINRYIMECKYTDVRGLGEALSGINRYIMECK